MSIPAVQRANEQRPRRVAGPLCSCIHDAWRWRELNPRPTLLREGFSGRSSLCPYSAPPVPRTSWCDRPSRCLLSLKIPRPDLLVIPLAGARIRVGRTPGLTDSLLAQAARAKSVRLEFALDFLQRMVNEIIVAFLGPLHLTGQTLSKPITPEGRTALPAYPLRRLGRSAFSDHSVRHALGASSGVPLELSIGIPLSHGLPLVVFLLTAR